MKTIGHKHVHISAVICNKQLIFGDWAFFIMLFQISTCIKLFLKFNFMTSALYHPIEGLIEDVSHSPLSALKEN